MNKKSKGLNLALFYTIVFFTGIVIVLTLGLVAPSFILFGIISPIAGLINLLGYIFNFDVPFIIFQIHGIEFNPIIDFILSIVIGIVLFVVGKFSWKLLLKYFHKIQEEKQIRKLNYKL